MSPLGNDVMPIGEFPSLKKVFPGFHKVDLKKSLSLNLVFHMMRSTNKKFSLNIRSINVYLFVLLLLPTSSECFIGPVVFGFTSLLSSSFNYLRCQMTECCDPPWVEANITGI